MCIIFKNWLTKGGKPKPNKRENVQPEGLISLYYTSIQKSSTYILNLLILKPE